MSYKATFLTHWPTGCDVSDPVNDENFLEQNIKI